MKERALFARNRELLGTGFVLALCMALLFLSPPDTLLLLENKVLDAYQRSVALGAPSERVVFVDIDEGSLARVGQWPWPRYKMARLAEKLAAARPAVVAFDIAFAEADRTSLTHLAGQLRGDLGYELDLASAPPTALDGDAAFARALAGGPFLLGYKFLFDPTPPGSAPCRIPPVTTLFRGAYESGSFFRAQGGVCTLPELAQAAGGGFFNALSDSDGLLRRSPLLIEYEGAFYPNLALAACLKAEKIDAVEVGVGAFGPTTLRYGAHEIPIDTRGRMLINFHGPGASYKRIAAADALEGKVPPDALAGKIVFVGTSASGLLDLRPTPLDAAHPGTEILATIADNLLVGDPVNRPPWALAVELLVTLCAVAFSTYLARSARPLWGLFAVVACSLVFFLVSKALYGQTRIILSPVLPALGLLVAYPCLVVVRTWLAEREIRRRNAKLLRTQDALIQSMAQMVEVRHTGTGGHIQRTSHYVKRLAEELRKFPKYREVLNDETIESLWRLAPLHDIGKVGVPDSVLLKQGPLTPEERAQMNRHPEFGAKTIRMAIDLIGDDTFLKFGEDFALCHQEKWDGSGYPRGLKGEEIPLAGRLMAVADAYDALASKREYKDALTHEETARLIEKGRGTFFDPDIVDAFNLCNRDFAAIAARFKEAEPALQSL